MTANKIVTSKEQETKLHLLNVKDLEASGRLSFTVLYKLTKLLSSFGGSDNGRVLIIQPVQSKPTIKI